MEVTASLSIVAYVASGDANTHLGLKRCLLQIQENHEESSLTFESKRSQLFGVLKDFEKHVHSSLKIEHRHHSNNTDPARCRSTHQQDGKDPRGTFHPWCTGSALVRIEM